MTISCGYRRDPREWARASGDGGLSPYSWGWDRCSRIFEDDMPTHDEISLRGMRFHTVIGVLPHETELRQPLEVDVTAYVAHASADHGALVDYRELYALVRGIVDGRQTAYLEDAAEAIAAGALQHGRVERIRVAVRKPHVALGGPLDHAEVVIERARDA